ncbi:DUF2490 domain-containing protein [Cytophagaceae bacterium ABcell3]|nr:DUF2490 domain-containing protein [Cytophagaceae bacterium ABcell3]
MLWTAFYINQDLGDQWEVELDIQHRRQNFGEDDWNFARFYQYQGYRAWLHFNPTNDFTISFSPLMYVHDVPISVDSWFEDVEEQDEFRFSLRMEKEYQHRFFNVSHRYGLEHRQISSDERPGYFWREWRARYLLRLTRPISSNTDLVFYNEAFLSFGSRIQYNVFDQNRTYLGLEFDAGDYLSFELAYMFQIIMQRSGDAFDSVNILYVSAKIRNLFGDR